MASLKKKKSDGESKNEAEETVSQPQNEQELSLNLRVSALDKDFLTKKKKKQNGLIPFAQVGMNRVDFVQSADEIGLCDPE